MNPRFPIKRHWVEIDVAGRSCVVEIRIEQTQNLKLYPPDGIKSVFMLRRERTVGAEDFEAIILIDNHSPFGFHEHPNLPETHEVREVIHASTWIEAWVTFDTRIKEIMSET